MADYTLSVDVTAFQSTLPREERHHSKLSFVDQLGISIHAPTRGATLFLAVCSTIHHISIHAPTRGATFFSSCCFLHIYISIHAPTRGATQILRFFSNLAYLFQSTLPREERLRGDGFVLEQGYNISIHAPTRGATLA